MPEPPICDKCDQPHWRFHPCPRPEPTQPAEVVWPAPPEGFRDPGFGEGTMLSRSLGKLGFGAPALLGFTRPRKRT